MTNIWGGHLRTAGRPTSAAQTNMRLGDNEDWSLLSATVIPAATAAAGEDWG